MSKGRCPSQTPGSILICVIITIVLKCYGDKLTVVLLVSLIISIVKIKIKLKKAEP